MSSRASRTGKRTDPKHLVRMFKYYLQFEDKTLRFRQRPEAIRPDTDYRENRKALDKLSKIIEKYDLDGERYVRYCVKGIGCRRVRELAAAENFIRYANHLKRVEQYGSIVHNFRRSAGNLAAMCIEHGTKPSEEMAKIILGGRLGYEYLSGRFSKYFIASLGNFEKIFEKLDPISQDELRILYNVAAELRQDVHRAFLIHEKRTVTPMELTAETIRELTIQQPKESSNEQPTVR